MVRRSPPTHPAALLFTGKPSECVHWVFASDNWHRVRWCHEIPAGTDLLRYYLMLMLTHHDEGWRLKEFRSYFASFNVERNGEALTIEITTIDPRVARKDAQGNYGAHFGSGPTKRR